MQPKGHHKPAWAGVAVVVAAVIFYSTVDPASSRWVPKCTFLMLTGWQCPGCGAQRMLHALLHGDFRAAWEANAMLLCMLPLLGVMAAAAWLRTRRPRLYALIYSPPAIALTTILLVAWGVLRNL